MELSDSQLVSEAIELNHASVGHERTLQRYLSHLDHFSYYLASVHEVTFYTVRRRHVQLYLSHLKKRGGPNPDELRLRCAWCRDHGYPDGRTGAGWSASYRKSHLSAIRFLYNHFLVEEDLPDRDPTRAIPSPKVVCARQYTPSKAEVTELLAAPGQPRDRLLAHWMFYAPSRRETFRQARWRDLDLDRGIWTVVGKNQKVEQFKLHARLIREFRTYKRWIMRQAERNDAIRDALAGDGTDYVLLSGEGNPVHASHLTKMIQWRAIRAGVGVYKTRTEWDCYGCKSSRMTPHALRRAWATIALNDEGWRSTS